MRLCSAIATCLIVVQTASTFSAAFAGPGHDGNFDTGRRFLRAVAPGAEIPAFDDTSWWMLDLPHDWSIEDLPTINGAPPSPFDPTADADGLKPATGVVKCVYRSSDE